MTTANDNKIIEMKEFGEKFAQTTLDRQGIWATLKLAAKDLFIGYPVKFYRKIVPYKYSDMKQGYTTKEKLEWYKRKHNGQTPGRRSYYALCDYYGAKDAQESLTKLFNTYSNYEITKASLDASKDYSNDANVVAIPLPKPKTKGGVKRN